ncbi:GIY-YIG nuclease family protein [Alicyclobacillus macrosporangiidus]|uniref:GIY-YIG nuclease family protein n=1 Tax=Alicyclobacillus macrosporangiidus TaxID=392015 RepID=UPI000497BB29|nr:GIY-YIG nuclease family protein [Alicyclobacillus macrosporangiidus]
MERLIPFEYKEKSVRVVMVDGEPWFVAESNAQLNQPPFNKMRDYLGFVYVVEYGSFIKIGKTQNPHQRMKSIKSVGRNYGDTTIGRILVSRPHTNFNENERSIHEALSHHRVRGELFAMTLDEFMAGKFGLTFRDDVEMLRKRTEAHVNVLKELLFPELVTRNGR